MCRLAIAAVTLAFVSSYAQAEDPSTRNLMKLANSVRTATLEKDYEKIADGTYPTLVRQFGGRAEMIKVMKQMYATLESDGFVIDDMKILKPKPVSQRDGKLFVIVPTEVFMTFPQGKIRAQSYLLAISDDQGAKWKFLDGSGLSDKEQREKVLPPLPENFRFPDPVAPQITPK